MSFSDSMAFSFARLDESGQELSSDCFVNSCKKNYGTDAAVRGGKGRLSFLQFGQDHRAQLGYAARAQSQNHVSRLSRSHDF